jgi:hypothetical protein
MRVSIDDDDKSLRLIHRALFGSWGLCVKQARTRPKFYLAHALEQRGASSRGRHTRPMLNFLGRNGLEPGQPYGQSGGLFNKSVVY